MSLNNLGNGQSALGQLEEALASTEESVAMYRRLAETYPDVCWSYLATGLMCLGAGHNARWGTGRHQRATVALIRAGLDLPPC